ncbi:hypothetical protein H4582DRAFT_464412 [Lactarius indigo]|nr:hypothetical protein H4582DRAFT_464412 [Lactarius indigo]
MTDWKSPSIVTAEYHALIKLFHVLAGIIIWELVVNMGFEYSVLTGKRKFRSSFLIYLGARWFPLFSTISILAVVDSANPINCKAFVISDFLFSYLSLISASALIVLRIAAIWRLNKIAISISSIAWLVHAGFLTYSVVVLRATWVEGVCEITNTSETRTNIPVTFVTDLVLLGLMLIGLLRRENAHQRGGIWLLLYTQGLVWMIIVVVAEALVTVFVLLNLNDPMNLMFQDPALITTTICASRMYRGLADYFFHNEVNVHTSGGLSEPPMRYLVPRSDQRFRALPPGTSGIPDARVP